MHASSVGVYSPGPKDRRVDESWPRGGVPTSFYSRHKAEAERRWTGWRDEAAGRPPAPGADLQARGGVGDPAAVHRPVAPVAAGASVAAAAAAAAAGPGVQAVHADDVGEAYRLAVTAPDARGAYNIAAEPVLDAGELGRLLGARPVTVPAGAVRALADADVARALAADAAGVAGHGAGVPLMDIARAREELGWQPRRSASDALLELLEGLRRSAGLDTPPLAPRAGGRFRLRELPAGVGARNP